LSDQIPITGENISRIESVLLRRAGLGILVVLNRVETVG